jgi:dolichyl-phosphate-mannose-protein mannosyltransferase
VALAAVLLLAASVLVVRRLAGAPLAAIVSCVFVFLTGSITLCGYLASALHRLTDARLWIAGAATALVLALVTARRSSDNVERPETPPRDRFRATRFESMLLAPMLAAVATAGLLNLIVALAAAPHAWDSLAYHLARDAYFLQHNSFDFFEANYWAQVVHPRGSSALEVFAFLTTRSERAFAVWQYAAYWVSVIVVFGIAVEAGRSRRQAWFAALLFALFTQSLMQATIPANDMLLAAYAAIATYALLRYRSDGAPGYLALASAATALGIGTKASFLLNVPLLAGVAVYALWRAGASRAWRRLAVFTLVAGVLVVLPSGYVANERMFGNPLGPPSVAERHAMTGRPISYNLREGSKNVLRFTLNFVSLDGLPRLRIVNRLQSAMRSVPAAIIPRLDIDLEHPWNEGRAQFLYARIASAHEATSYWGILGFALVWWSVVAALFRRGDAAGVRLLAALAIGYLLVQSYLTLYDPWRGRYFLTAGIFAAPVAARWLAPATRVGRIYAAAIVWVACLSAITAVVLRSNRMMISVEYDGHVRPSVFRLDRIGQLSQNDTSVETPIRRFESLVPADAIVAVCMPPDEFEYALFGDGLTRRLIPINSFAHGRQPVPPEADDLIFTSTVEGVRPSDVALGSDWYLRRLRAGGAEQSEHR